MNHGLPTGAGGDPNLRPGTSAVAGLSVAEQARPTSRNPDRDAGRLAAGWGLPAAVALDGYGNESFSWGALRTLWAARNEKLFTPILRLYRHVRDPANAQRNAWVDYLTGTQSASGERLRDELIIRPPRSEQASFYLVGDPGEGDKSQGCVVDPLLRRDDDDATQFMLIVSDVIYPAGATADYETKFYKPYENYRKPVYAVPGNHDWDDGDLSGFIFHFCDFGDSFSTPDAVGLATPSRWPWRRASAAAAEIAELRVSRDAFYTQDFPRQPGPYFAIDTGPLLVVAIDTGFANRLDEQQGQWLKSVSEMPKPKLLVTGKPIWVDGERKPSAIDGMARDVDSIVRKRSHGYVAAIGGDIHNYQRYPVEVEPGRTIHYIVSGGGGAFLSGTHTIPKICIDEDEPYARADEAGVRFYPLRGHSLRFFNAAYKRKIEQTHFASAMALMISLAVVLLAGVIALGSSVLVPPRDWVSAIAGAALLVVTGAVLLPLRKAARQVAVPLVGAAGLVALTRVGADNWAHASIAAPFEAAAELLTKLGVVPVLSDVAPHLAVRPVESLWSDAASASPSTAAALGLLAFALVTTCLVAGLAFLGQGAGGWRLAGGLPILLAAIGVLLIGVGLSLDSVTDPMRWGLASALGGAVVAFVIVWFSLRLTAAIQLTDREAERIEAINKDISRPAVRPSHAKRMFAWCLRLLPSGRLLGDAYYPLVELNEPPFFKSFLHISASDEELTIRCWAATGAEAHVPKENTPLEDKIIIPLAPVIEANGW